MTDERPTMMQAAAAGLCLLALRERGFQVDEESPTTLRAVAPDGQAFTVTVTRTRGGTRWPVETYPSHTHTYGVGQCPVCGANGVSEATVEPPV